MLELQKKKIELYAKAAELKEKQDITEDGYHKMVKAVDWLQWGEE